MTTVYWQCATCTTVGTRDRSAEQHTRATTHTTITGIDPAALARMLGTHMVTADEATQ